MDEAFLAYAAGRDDGLDAHRDNDRAAHPETGADYRMGFLDGRIEVFRLHAELRKITEE